ncbi:cupin domain-containing protein [Kordiimonas lacus]|uniref:Cupin domain-containing protein n=1 Tax=Kordiimonas lacus TaxID=637679 RepID=A0A1G6XKQ4_9PROT|nr:cupin domain-containing protein [Kordiimonas lacus]SDD78720.1 Cupin domain-containing protein [Kordiimonas lacus]
MKTTIVAFAASMLCATAALAGAEVKLKGAEDVLGNAISYPEGQAEITGLDVVQKPGECNGWHSHPVPTFGLVKSGELTVTYATGEVKKFSAGDMLIEAQHVAHEGCNTGNADLEVLVFYAGSKDVPNTHKREDERPQ